MKTPHNWGIIGAGSIAHSFAADLAHVPDATLVGVASRSQQSATALAGIASSAVAHASVADLLADPSVEIVYIASPPRFHEEQAIAALRAGKHVLVEKPFTLDAPSTQRVSEAAHANQRFCMEAMWSRFLPAIVEAKRVIMSGDLGELRLVSADFSLAVTAGTNHHLDHPFGGGALGDRGLYGVSLTRYLIGAPDRVDSHVHRNGDGVDEDATILLHHPDGVLAALTTSMRVRGTNRMVLMGTNATLTLAAPFWGATQFSIQPSEARVLGPSRTTVAAPPSAAAAFAHRAKRHPFAVSAKHLVRAVVGEVRSTQHPYAGHGLHLEAAHVQRCVEAGRVESDVMPLSESLAVMETLDTIRRRWDT